ncbi:MAG TPA: MBL fold metallo-hydrolase [Vicinamibacterales bacterium]|nr:MBL fold metallo-hydrolase [Vicinamibacterales bacterium]
MNRRRFVAAVAGLLASAATRVGAAASQSARTRLILLGTGGGPRPRPTTMASAQVIVAGDRLYVVDCGDGVARQLVLAGLSLPSLRHVFITHHHSDHNADYGNLLLLSWASGLRDRVDTWGPPPIDRITRLFLEMSATDIDTRVADEGRSPLAPLIHVHELAAPGVVMQDDRVKVTSAVARHPMIESAFAYRFDAADRSIVISGDTAMSDEVIKLAKGADVLVHEVLDPDAVDRLAARVPTAATLKKHLLASHTTAEECGRIAAAAEVKTLVLSHFVPADDPLVTDATWSEGARRHFKGRIIVGRDLMEI